MLWVISLKIDVEVCLSVFLLFSLVSWLVRNKLVMRLLVLCGGLLIVVCFVVIVFFGLVSRLVMVFW